MNPISLMNSRKINYHGPETHAAALRSGRRSLKFGHIVVVFGLLLGFASAVTQQQIDRMEREAARAARYAAQSSESSSDCSDDYLNLAEMKLAADELKLAAELKEQKLAEQKLAKRKLAERKQRDVELSLLKQNAQDEKETLEIREHSIEILNPDLGDTFAKACYENGVKTWEDMREACADQTWIIDICTRYCSKLIHVTFVKKPFGFKTVEPVFANGRKIGKGATVSSLTKTMEKKGVHASDIASRKLGVSTYVDRHSNIMSVNGLTVHNMPRDKILDILESAELPVKVIFGTPPTRKVMDKLHRELSTKRGIRITKAEEESKAEE